MSECAYYYDGECTLDDTTCPYATGDEYCCDGFEYYQDYDDGMDGDHASALASVGWGTDEDYGYYGEDC